MESFFNLVLNEKNDFIVLIYDLNKNNEQNKKIFIIKVIS